MQAEAECNSHCIHFFEPDRFPATEVAAFLRKGLSNGEGSILIASLKHISQIETAIEMLGVRVADLRASQLWAVADVEELIQSLEDGMPTKVLVESLIESTVLPMQQRGPGKSVRIYGELEDLVLTRMRDAAAALEIERYGNRLASEGVARIYCGYSTNAFPDASFAKPFIKLCQLHDQIHNDLSDPEDWRYQMAMKLAAP